MLKSCVALIALSLFSPAHFEGIARPNSIFVAQSLSSLSRRRFGCAAVSGYNSIGSHEDDFKACPQTGIQSRTSSEMGRAQTSN